MDKNLLGFIISVSAYLVILAYVKLLPKIDVIHKENHKEVILWYNNIKGKRKWIYLFNLRI